MLVGVALSACSPTPQPIDLGTDLCDHCKMTIVQEPFAAELVTKKGKVFKFDAIECMAAYLNDKEDSEFEFFLVKDLNEPAEWQDARTSSYLVSKALPSPMGAFLSAYKDADGANEMREAKGGEVFDWKNLRQYLSNL
jgi:copper chaperone NosL